MFNLENAISQWRYESGLGEDISQRETQLRESLASLQQQGLSEEEAFMVTSHRVGRPTGKTIEYETESSLVSSWRDRLYWMIAGGLAMKAGMVIVTMVGTGSMHLLGVLEEYGLSSLVSPGTMGVCTVLVSHAIAILVLYNVWFHARRGWHFGSAPAIAFVVAFITLAPLVWQLANINFFSSVAATSWADWGRSFNYATWIASIVTTVAMGVALWMLRSQQRLRKAG